MVCKKIALLALSSLLISPLALTVMPKQSAAASGKPAVIRPGSTYLLDFEGGTLLNGTYRDGSSNAFKFAGDTSGVALSDGQLVMGPLNASTIGVFDYGFTSNPLTKFEDFEMSFDMTMTHRELNKQVGIQFQKQAWNDGWDAQMKTHITYDGKMNFFEGAASIANTDSSKYRSIKDYGVPALNRDIMPWETFRVKLVAEGTRIRTYLNGASVPVVDVQRSAEVEQGFVGVFANANTGFKMDNFLFNRLNVEGERDDYGVAGDSNGIYIYIPALNESVSKYNIRLQSVTDSTYIQSVSYTGPRDRYIHIDNLTPGMDYSVQLVPVYTSDRTLVDTEIAMFATKTVHVGDPLQTQLSVSTGGTFYEGAKRIDFSVIGADAIRYTVDGSEPGLTHGIEVSGDFIFGGSLEVDRTTTFKAVAILDGQIKTSQVQTYTAGVNPVQLTGSAVFHSSMNAVLQSVYADSLIYTANGSVPLYDPVTDTASNGTMVRASAVNVSVTESTYLKAIGVRDGLAGPMAWAKYTKVPVSGALVTDWNFTSSSVVAAEEQDELYGKSSGPWSQLLGWDVNSDKGVWANHIQTNQVYRDTEGVHLFTTAEPIAATTSNPNFYLDLHDAGLPDIPSEYRYLSLWMKVNHTANGAIYFGTDAGPDTNRLSESRKVAFRNTASETPEFQQYILDMGRHEGWSGNITKLRIDPMATYPSMKDGIEIVMRDIKLLRKADLPAEVRLTRFETSSQEIVSPGDTFVIQAELENIGADTGAVTVQLDAPDFIQITPLGTLPGTNLGPGDSAVLTYRAVVTGTGAGGIALTISGSGIPTTRGLSRIFSVNDSLPASGQTDDVIIGDMKRRLVFPSPAQTGLEGYGFAWLEAERGGDWSRIAVLPSLGSVQQVMDDGHMEVRELYAPAPTILQPGDFNVSFQDSDGVCWSGNVSVAMNVYGHAAIGHALQADSPRQIAAVIGPTLLLGEAGVPALDPQHQVIRSAAASPGDYIHEALFPGLEWLDNMDHNNRSSDKEAVIDNSDAYRYVPNPRKVTVPLMALRKNDRIFGLMWDANQLWDGTHDQPSALFGLPNRMERGEDTISTKLSLFIPSIFSGVNENATYATGIPAFYDKLMANSNNENPVRQPYSLPAEQKIELKAQLFVNEGTEISSAILDWTHLYGLPQPLDYAHGTMKQESEAILTSFENLWNPLEAKWNNRIGPAATPLITSAFVMPYAVLGKYADEELQNIAEQRINTAMTGIGSNYSTYGYVLPFYLEGIAGRSLEALQSVNVDSLISTAKLVNPASVTEGVYWDYQTYIERKGFPASPYIGKLTDITAGSNGEFIFKMLRHARLAGLNSAKAYGLAALDYVNDSFALPRGSQSWELRNMIPELDTAGLLVRANVEAYALTGDSDYLRQARVWADRGMPFIYLWDDGSYGEDKADGRGGFYGSHTFMRYGAVAAFGQSIYRTDGKPLPGTWFGRTVQWSGHNFGIALMDLYGAMNRAEVWEDHLQSGGMDYYRISLGLSVSGSRQTTAADNKYPTHLYDAASLIKWETSDYLYPNYQGAELLGLLLGERTSPVTQVVTMGTKEVRISAPANVEVLLAESSQLIIGMEFAGPGEYTVLLQGISAIGHIQFDDLGTGAELVSHTVRSGSALAEIHLKVAEEGISGVALELTGVVLK
jgi:hypothetical protein